MREFRILGPLEVAFDGQTVELAGQRQRALLVALLVHHDQVVSSDRLIDLIWGEHAPRTATTSLQNAVSQLRRDLGADIVETRAPGYVLAADSDEIDAVRFEALVAQARGVPAAERAALLRSALALWRGPALADLAGEEFTQGEIRRLEELRLDALEERIAADIELGLHREVIGELEALAALSPLRERVCALRMLALYRSGRQAEALRAFREMRTAFVDELGIEPGAELQALHAQVLRQEAGLGGAGGGASPPGDIEGEILRAILAGRLVPVIGLAGGPELARRLAETFDVPSEVAGSLGRVTQYVAAMQGLGPLHDELHSLDELSEKPGPIHHLLARIPSLLRDRGAPYQLIVTTAFDGAVEHAFAEAGEELDVVTYIAAGAEKGRFVHSPPDGSSRTVDVPNAYADLSLEQRTVLLRLRGISDPTLASSWESLVVTEDDHIGYLGPGELESAIPVTLAARLRRSHLLFLGCDLADWDLRLVVDRLRGGRAAPYASWAVRAAPTALELALWRHLDITSVDVDESAFAHLLDSRLDGMASV
jgi:DNA-binding SARP family transcriptional activator